MSSVFYVFQDTLKFFKVFCEGVTPSRSRAVWDLKIVMFAYNSERELFKFTYNSETNGDGAEMSKL